MQVGKLTSLNITKFTCFIWFLLQLNEFLHINIQETLAIVTVNYHYIQALCSKANMAYNQVVNFCLVLFSLDWDDFEWTIWDPEGTKSHSHFQQRRKPLCNRGIDPMSKGLLEWWLCLKSWIAWRVYHRNSRNFYFKIFTRLNYSYFYFWSFFFFLNMYK